MNISQTVINPLVWKGLKLSKLKRILQAITHLASDCKLKDNAFLEKEGFEESQMIFLRAHDINLNLEILPQ